MFAMIRNWVRTALGCRKVRAREGLGLARLGVNVVLVPRVSREFP